MPKPVTPLLTVDILIELLDQPQRPVVLIERRNPPFGLAIPGGFVDEGEALEQAAVREAKEETCLDVTLQTLLGCYSDPQRDPRLHTASATYVATAHGIPQAADDAAAIVVCTPPEIPDEMAFDHGLILADYVRYRKTGTLAPLRHSGDHR